MKPFPTIYPCQTKEELYKQVTDVHKAIADFYRSLPPELFDCHAVPDGWSVKRNMKHVISTNYSFGFWVGLPAFILKLRGKPKEKQLSIDAIVPTNRSGITNYGRYEKSHPIHLHRRDKLLEMIPISAEKLNGNIAKRSEEELDTLAGIFSGMSLRTFIYFLLKHNLHHTNVVRLRIES